MSRSAICVSVVVILLALGAPAVPLASSQPPPTQPAALSSDGGFWHDHGPRVAVIAAAVGLLTSLAFVMSLHRVRRQAQRELEENLSRARDGASPTDRAALAADALASLSGHVAILDRDGAIVAVNDAWNHFGTSNGIQDLAAIGPHVNYLEVCARGARAGAPKAAAAHEGIEAVCQGRRAEFELDYRCDGPLESDWFQMKVTPLRAGHGGAVISHRNITALKRHEIAARERSLSMFVDALPVAVKLVDAHGLGRHFNTTWLRMTGRALDDELGRHWLERVHAEDRPECERAYQAAVDSRRPGTLEYRVQTQDGHTRWLLDRIVPRYGDDGRFDGFVCAAIDVTGRRRIQGRLRELTGRLVTAQEEERRRIARELHDDLQQRLALLAIGIEQASAAFARDEAARERLRDLWQQTTDLSKAVHALSHELHSTALEALGLVPAVRKLARELTEKGLRVTLTADDACSEVSREAALGLFRIAQEALVNVLKHSGVQDAFVTLRATDDRVILLIEDRGRGFDPDGDYGGIGLLGMKERLTPVGGAVQIRSHPGEGTSIEARVPRARADATSPSCAA